jgi:hypothetical protein
LEESNLLKRIVTGDETKYQSTMKKSRVSRPERSANVKII